MEFIHIKEPDNDKKTHYWFIRDGNATPITAEDIRNGEKSSPEKDTKKLNAFKDYLGQLDLNETIRYDRVGLDVLSIPFIRVVASDHQIAALQAAGKDRMNFLPIKDTKKRLEKNAGLHPFDPKTFIFTGEVTPSPDTATDAPAPEGVDKGPA